MDLVFQLPTFFDLELLIWYTEAGNKKALAQSAEYPYAFGAACAALVPDRLPRFDFTMVDLSSYEGADDIGSLDDLLRGKHRAWWRKL